MGQKLNHTRYFDKIKTDLWNIIIGFKLTASLSKIKVGKRQLKWPIKKHIGIIYVKRITCEYKDYSN
jgi:hypothetical protein